MLVPLILFGTMEYALGFNPNSPIIWQSIVAVTTGAPAIVAIISAFLNGPATWCDCFARILDFQGNARLLHA